MGVRFPTFSKTRLSGHSAPETGPLRPQERDGARLLVGLGLSLALHAAAMAAIVTATHASHPGEADAARQAQSEPDPDRQDPEEIKLGVDRSSAVTLTWIGFEEATPHEARRSEVDQAAVAELAGERTLHPGDPGQPSPEAPPAEQDIDAPAEPGDLASTTIEEAFEPEDQPLEEPAEQPDTTEPGDEPAETVIETETTEAEQPTEGSTLPVEVGPSPDAAPGPLEIVDNQLQPPAPALPMPQEGELENQEAPDEAREAEQAEPADQADRTQTADNAPTGDRGEGGGAEGQTTEDDRIPSDREADAAATDEPHEVRPGQPLAAEGLRVQTRGRPDFSVITRLTGARRTPVYAITFGRDGRVKNVEIVESSGNSNVDEPWRNVLYRWTATGERLEQLPEDDPKAGVTIKIRLLAPPGRF